MPSSNDLKKKSCGGKKDTNSNKKDIKPMMKPNMKKHPVKKKDEEDHDDDEDSEDIYETCDESDDSDEDDDDDSYESSFIDDEDEEEYDSEEDSSEEDDTEESDEEEESEESEEEVKKTKSKSKSKSKKGKFYIVLDTKKLSSAANKKFLDSEEEEEDENVSVSSVGTDELQMRPKRSLQTQDKKSVKKAKIDQQSDKQSDKQEEESDKDKEEDKDKSSDTVESDTIKSDKPGDKLLSKFMTLYEKTKDEKIIKGCIDGFEEIIRKEELKKEKKIEKQSAKNGRIFTKLLKNSRKLTDVEHFKKLSMEVQLKILKELREINDSIFVKTPYRIRLLELDIPTTFKISAMKKVSLLRNIEPGSGEYYKCKLWVDGFMKIPFNTLSKLPVCIEDGLDKCDEFIGNAKETLDAAVFGLDNAKMQIIQWLGQLITNPQSVGTAVAIQGPPGTGKTSLIKEGISKILKRPFAFIALGGATDSSFLDGHCYTYEGSTYGKIVQILIESQCMNPIIFFDELDKISDTPKGEEITGILTHLTDTTQNSQFHDKFFSELDFDLSKCLFIFSYNDESKLNPILKDRMYRILTKGFDVKQKTSIASQYLLPKLKKEIHFQDSDVIFTDEVIHYVLNTFCGKEDGVRNLKRCMEVILTKLNLFRLLKPSNMIIQKDLKGIGEISFPLTITKELLEKLLSRDEMQSTSHLSMYI